MKKSTILDFKQVRILEDLFVRSLAGESMEKVSESHGISRKTLSQWKNTDHGKQLHAKFQKEMSTNDLPKFYQVLSEKMQAGSYKHMELYAKIHGLLAPEKQEIVSRDERSHIVKNGLSKDAIQDLRDLLDGKSTKITRVK